MFCTYIFQVPVQEAPYRAVTDAHEEGTEQPGPVVHRHEYLEGRVDLRLWLAV